MCPVVYFMRGKRAISAIVATVLIILITVAAIGVLWVAIIPMIQTAVDFSDLQGRVMILNKGYTAYDSVEEIAMVQVKRDVDEGVMNRIKITFDVEGNSHSSSVVAPESGGTKVYTFDVSGIGEPDSVSVAPIFASGNREKEGAVTSEVNIPSSTLGEVGAVVYEVGKDYTSDQTVYRNDDNESDISRSGDGGDDGVNKWIDVRFVDSDWGYFLWIYGRATHCNESAGEDYRLRVNSESSQTLSFNWCDIFGLDSGATLVTSDWEWKKFEIPGSWLIEGENQFNFWDASGACGWRCANWNIGSDTDNDFGKSAWSSNDYPPCQPLRSTNPLRQDGSCYDEELMIYLTT